MSKLPIQIWKQKTHYLDWVERLGREVELEMWNTAIHWGDTQLGFFFFFLKRKDKTLKSAYKHSGISLLFFSFVFVTEFEASWGDGLYVFSLLP